MRSVDLHQSSKMLFVFLFFLACVSGPFCSAALAQNYVFGIGSFPVPAITPAIVSADFNHDGKLDLAVGSNGELTVMLGTPDGSFTTKDYTYGSVYNPSTAAIALGDFNGDGNLDIAVVLTTNPPVLVFLGKGDGTFEAPITVQVGSASSVTGVAVGDFNHDGKADLAVAGNSSNNGMVTVLLGNGDGTFQSGVNYPVGGTASGGIVAADFNNDGNLDLAEGGGGSTNGNVVSVLMGKGDGTFQAYTPYSVPGNGPVHMAVGDLNGNGNLDVVAASYVIASGGFSVLMGNGDGSFQPAVTYSDPPGIDFTQNVAVADIDGDGKPDVVAVDSGNNDVSVFKGNGDGTFQNPAYYGVGYSPSGLALGDFNDDGQTDLAVISGYGTYSLTVLLGKGGGTFPDHTDYRVGNPPYYSTVTGDFNGDGNMDIATTGFAPSGTVSVLLGNGDGTFGNHVDTPLGSYPGYAAAGDFNGDGRTDLVVANTSNSNERLSTLLANSDGTFKDAFNILLSSVPGKIVAADFNNDGKLDLAMVQQLNSSVSVFLGNGNGSFSGPVEYSLGTTGSSGRIYTGDFNKDGKTDLAVDMNGTAIEILWGNGDGSFQSPATLFPGARLLAVGDFNGDGTPDLCLLTNSGFAVALSNGDGTFRLVYTTSPIYNLPASDEVITGDFNGDGKLDLAFSDTQPQGLVSVLFGNGDGTFGNQVYYSTAANPYTPAAGDFNGNGVLDLAVPCAGNNGADFVSVLLNSPVASIYPEALAFANRLAGTTSPAQNVILANSSAAPLAIASIATSSDFQESDNCGTKLGAAANCQMGVSFAPTAGGNLTGTLSIAENASSTPATVRLSGTGEDFTLGVASGSSSSGTISAGGTANYTLTVAPQGGFNQAVSLACTGQPSGDKCTVSPGSVTLDGANSDTVKVAVTMPAATALAPGAGPNPFSGPLPEMLLLAGLGLLGLALWREARPRSNRLRHRWAMIAGALLLAAGLAACGGGGGTSTSSASSSSRYTLTVTGASGNIQHSTTLNLSVQ